MAKMAAIMYFVVLNLWFVLNPSSALPVVDSKPNSIVLQISSGNNSCNNKYLFANFAWDEVPEFGFLCNIPIQDIQQAQTLLKMDIVPILCMGFYDTSLRLCKSALNDSRPSSPLNKVFPATPEKMNNLIKKLSQQDDYSSLKRFCEKTVKEFKTNNNNTISESNATAEWRKLIEDEFKNERDCNSVCRTTENDKVHPLCSYIVWSNNQTLQVSIPLKSNKPNEGLKSKVEDKSEVSSTSVPEQKVQATTPSLKTDSPADGSLGQKNVDQNQREPEKANGAADDGPDEQRESKSDQPGKHDAKEVILLEDPAPDRQNQSAVVNKGSPPAVEENIDFSPASKIDSVKTGQQPGETAQGDLSDAKGPGGSEGERGRGSELAQPTVEVTGDKAPRAESKPTSVPSDGDAIEGVGDADMPLQDDEDDDDGIPYADVTKPKKQISDGVGKIDPDYAHQDVVVVEDHFIEREDTHFFTYFFFMAVLTILAYLAFHNKKKLLALAVEGRRSRGGRRRPNSSNYSKLDCSLEEAMSSKTTASVTHVLY